jgi:hypothetical protein
MAKIIADLFIDQGYPSVELAQREASRALINTLEV